MKKLGARQVLAVVVALVGFGGVFGCGDAEVDTACCQLLLLCDHCGCATDTWTIASSGEGKACKDTLASVSCQGVIYSSTEAENACK